VKLVIVLVGSCEWVFSQNIVANKLKSLFIVTVVRLCR
jgi:hypothetical protein